jgi:hypothetical protein
VSTPVTKFVPLIRTWSASAKPFLRRKAKRPEVDVAVAVAVAVVAPPARGLASDNVGDDDEASGAASRAWATVDIRRLNDDGGGDDDDDGSRARQPRRAKCTPPTADRTATAAKRQDR